MKKERIDNLLINRGLADSLPKARALVMAGVVLVDERRVGNASETFSQKAAIRIKGDSPEKKYASRGGLKLEKALKEFQICVSECVCLDVGSSTGGFTDCLLQNGAKKVCAVDSGTNQLDWKIRKDARVEARENVNARYLKPEHFPEKFDLVVMDVSFISATKILPVLVRLLKTSGKAVVLIKPQFEAKKAEVSDGGIIKDEKIQARVVAEVNDCAEKSGLKVLGVIDSPILGMNGNKEFLVCYQS